MEPAATLIPQCRIHAARPTVQAPAESGSSQAPTRYGPLARCTRSRGTDPNIFDSGGTRSLSGISREVGFPFSTSFFGISNEDASDLLMSAAHPAPLGVEP